ncbi:hypothetical protein NEOLEDRAFT_1080689, partial [Neolentinus lepideus HHB14362 ss-1]
RQPRAGCEISPSPFRPHVPAMNCMRAWTSPFSDDFDRRLRLELSPLSAHKTKELLLSALEPNTRTDYGDGLLKFHQFCDEQGIPESSRMPASAYLLAGFVAWRAGLVSGSTIEAWLTAVRAWHDINGARWEGDACFVSLVMTSASKVSPASSRRGKHPCLVGREIKKES